MAKGKRGKPRRRQEGIARTILTPIQGGGLVSLSNEEGGDGKLLFRKRILPDTTIRHPNTGEPVVFDRAYRQSLIDAFKAGAYDQVPLQFAGKDNAHTMDVERTRGEVVSLSHESDGEDPGLYATIRAHTRKAAKVIQRNPALGVSCQIREQMHRVDGARYPRALRHVLATLDPRVVRLGRWQTVSLSADEVGELLDLTNATEEKPVAKIGGKGGKGGKGKGGAPAVLELSEDEAEAAVWAAVLDLEPDELALSNGGDGDNDPRLLSLAAGLEQQRSETRQVRGQLAASQWETERGKLSKAGVPKPFLDLAEELLANADASEAVLELSNADGETVKVDPARILRDMLDECKGLIDLANPGGFSVEPDDGGEAAHTATLKAGWDARSGPAKQQ